MLTYLDMLAKVVFGEYWFFWKQIALNGEYSNTWQSITILNGQVLRNKWQSIIVILCKGILRIVSLPSIYLDSTT